MNGFYGTEKWQFFFLKCMASTVTLKNQREGAVRGAENGADLVTFQTMGLLLKTCEDFPVLRRA